MSSREVSVLSTTKVDPRIIRTKKLLVEAFQEVSREKRMSQITVKDITERATVNRATFYAHFTDKYDILDYTLSETILKDLNDTLSISDVINEIVISNLFVSIAHYMVEVQESCKLNSETFCNQAHKRINNELEDIFTIMLRNSYRIMILRYLLIVQVSLLLVFVDLPDIGSIQVHFLFNLL